MKRVKKKKKTDGLIRNLQGKEADKGDTETRMLKRLCALCCITGTDKKKT